MSLFPTEYVTTPYGGCTCSCHRTGAKHVIACCSPSNERHGKTLPRQWKFTIAGAPRTKKTSNRLIPAKAGRRAVILPSAAFAAWNRIAQMELARVRSKLSGLPITVNVTVRAWFYREADTGDVAGFYQAIGDALEEGRIIGNDNLIRDWDGSRPMVDRDNPRVEVCITEIL